MIFKALDLHLASNEEALLDMGPKTTRMVKRHLSLLRYSVSSRGYASNF